MMIMASIGRIDAFLKQDSTFEAYFKKPSMAL